MSEVRKVTFEFEVTGESFYEVYGEIAEALRVIEDDDYDAGWAAWKVLDVKIARTSPDVTVKQFVGGGIIPTVITNC